MAKADFCFTYYDGDATRDMAHMNRLERGAYNDVIIQQRQRGHMSLDDMKKFLSRDFETVWPALEWILKVDEEGKYYIEWLENSVKRGAAHSKKQRENVLNRYQTATKPLPKNDLETPLGDGYGYGDEEDSLKRGEGEKLLVPQMLTVLKDHLPFYAVSAGRDYQPLYDIAAFLAEQVGAGPPLQNIGVVVAEWRKICEYLANPENFYHKKSLKTISTHIQEIFQRHEQPKRDSKKNGLGPKSGGFGILSEVEREIGLLGPESD